MFIKLGDRYINASHITSVQYYRGGVGFSPHIVVELLDQGSQFFRGEGAEALVAYLDFASTDVVRWRSLHEEKARQTKERDEQCHAGQHDYEAGEICVNCLHRKGQAA